MSMNLASMDINQCSRRGADETEDEGINRFFRGTHVCPSYSVCTPIKHYGLRDGGYKCSCKSGYASLLPSTAPPLRIVASWGKDVKSNIPATTTETTTLTETTQQITDISCFKCSAYFCHELCLESMNCTKIRLPHISDYVVVTLLSIHVFVMFAVLLPAALIIKMRRIKFGAYDPTQVYHLIRKQRWAIQLKLQTRVALEYLEATKITCVLIPWFREIGFITLYASIMLKVHRVRVESQSRQAQRVLLRDKDLLRYLAVILFLAACQMAAWTAMQIGREVNETEWSGNVCGVGWWHFVVQVVFKNALSLYRDRKILLHGFFFMQPIDGLTLFDVVVVAECFLTDPVASLG
ncbi:hypothetical protein HELRODRAFT_164004 [Helobdella robusta]|uniref:GPR158/179 extracellular domain-containing protein n=1 Tax=Helobdella robusta TaxID=6412 RepID=T1EUR2_HELRO|nr:hypothetical protein HELRODRAFT_164004 [Helobdella robusta]ESN94207.1 hypothetical protein HELRODRAFT_164004 [Helobdella robusta]